MQFRRLTQEQLDNFTLDINTAYARLKGIEQAVESEHRSHLFKEQSRFLSKSGA